MLVSSYSLSITTAKPMKNKTRLYQTQTQDFTLVSSNLSAWRCSRPMEVMHNTFASVLFFTWNIELILLIFDMMVTRAVLKLQCWTKILGQSEEIKKFFWQFLLLRNSWKPLTKFCFRKGDWEQAMSQTKLDIFLAFPNILRI